jgi:hypothetical protein
VISCWEPERLISQSQGHDREAGALSKPIGNEEWKSHFSGPLQGKGVCNGCTHIYCPIREHCSFTLTQSVFVSTPKMKAEGPS